MFCKNCGKQIDGVGKFCGKCSQKVEVAIKATTKEKEGENKSLLGRIVTVVVFILAFVAFRYLTQEAISPSTNLDIQDSTSRSELIVDIVREVKSTIALPTQFDEVTIWNDVTAQPNAIRYHYTLIGADTSNLSNSYFESYLSPILCSNQDTRHILDQDINMEYSYVVQGSAQSYFVSFTKADCL